MAIAFLLLLGRETLSSFATVIIPNYLFLMGFYALIYGTRLYLGVKNFPVSWVFMASVVFVSCFLYFFYVFPSLQMRAYIITSGIICIFVISAWDSLSRASLQYPARLFYGSNCVLMIVAQCVYMISTAKLSAGAVALSVSGWAQMYWLLLLIHMVFTAISIILLVTERLSQSLRFYSEHDNLTSVFNRRIFLVLLSKLLHGMKRDKSPAGLLFIDLDHFKKINDSHGHNAGDEVLRHFVDITQNQLRSEDTIGRMGGEEFAVILPKTSHSDAENIAERIRLVCETSPLVIADNKIHFTVSIGLVNIDCNDSEKRVLELADKAMYNAKNIGRNKVVAYA